MSEDPDKFTNITLLLCLSILLNQDRPTDQSRAQVESDEFSLGGLAGILGVKDDVVATYVPESATVVVATQSETDLDAVYMAPLGPTRYPIIVPNSEGCRNAQGKDITTNPHRLRLLNVNDATDFWPQVKINEWCCVNKNVTLEQHVKTVASYLNDYKSVSGDLRLDYARHFYSYLISVCWKKMFSRISSWSAVGLISGLKTVLGNGGVEAAIDRFPWSAMDMERRSGDRTLVRTLKDASMLAIPAMMATLDAEHRSLDQLIPAVEAALMGNGNYRIYTKATARQFHCLLLAAFINFAKELNGIDDAIRNNVEAEELVAIFRSFAIWVRILTCILASPSFEEHLWVLMHAKKLSIVIPVFELRETYGFFATQLGIHLNLSPDYQDDSDMPQGLDYLEPETSLAPLLRWVKTFVAQFFAKRSLEASIQYPMQNSFIIAIDRSHCVVPPSWRDMERIIKEAMSLGVGTDVQIVIEMLRDKITMGTPGRDGKGKMIRFFQDLIDQKIEKIPARLHAEILLRTLDLVPREEIALGTNDECLQVICDAIYQRPFLISMSRPCCPVCRVFFQVVNGTHSVSDPMVRHSLSGLFPVQLPWCTPPMIRKEMEEIFLGYLRKELVEIVKVSSLTPLLASTQSRCSNLAASTANSTLAGQPPEFYSNVWQR